jgi:hypothetical protein
MLATLFSRMVNIRLNFFSCFVGRLYNKNQQDSLLTFNLFQ